MGTRPIAEDASKKGLNLQQKETEEVIDPEEEEGEDKEFVLKYWAWNMSFCQDTVGE